MSNFGRKLRRDTMPRFGMTRDAQRLVGAQHSALQRAQEKMDRDLHELHRLTVDYVDQHHAIDRWADDGGRVQ